MIAFYVRNVGLKIAGFIIFIIFFFIYHIVSMNVISSHDIVILLFLTLVILVPLWMNPFLQDAFELPKAHIGAAIMAVISICTAINTYRYFSKNSYSFAITKRVYGILATERIFMLIFVFIIANIIGAINSKNAIKIIAHFEPNSQSMISSLMGCAIFLLGFLNFYKRNYIELLIVAIIIGSVPVAIYGLFQWLNIDWLKWYTDSSSSVFSTMGRSNFFSSYLTMVMPFSVSAIYLSKTRWHRVIFGMLLLLQFTCVIIAKSRTSWISLYLVFALIIITFLWRLYINKKPLKLNIMKKLSKSLSVSFVLLFLFGIIIFLKEYQVLIHDESMMRRYVVWRTTVELIEKKWLFGYGPTMFQSEFHNFYPTEWKTQRLFFVFTNPHNIVLEIFFNSGIFGVTSSTGILYEMIKRGQSIFVFQEINDIAIFGPFYISGILFLIQELVMPSFIVGQLFFWLSLSIIIRSKNMHSQSTIMQNNISDRIRQDSLT